MYYILVLLTLSLLLFWSSWLRKFRLAAPGMLYCSTGEDDSDMKIVGSAPHTEPSIDIEDELEELRSGGDLDKARQLGTELSQKILDEDSVSFGLDASESAEVRQQRRLLMAFVVDYSVDRLIPNRILCTTVINRFYDELKKNVPEFYEDIRESASFTFYLLCIRRDGNTDCMGCSFAMLAGCEGDAVMAELGQALFFRFSDVVEQSIRTYFKIKI